MAVTAKLIYLKNKSYAKSETTPSITTPLRPPPAHAMCSQFHLRQHVVSKKHGGGRRGSAGGAGGLACLGSKVRQTPLPYRAYRPYMKGAGGNINISEETNWP